MASQSAIAEGESSGYATSDQINYKQRPFSHPSYVFAPQFSNQFGAPVVLTSSQTPVTITLPPEVFNLAESVLQYSVNLPAPAAGQYIWYAAQALKEISHLQYYSGSNMWMADIDNLQNYLDIVLKKELEQDEFLSNPIETGEYRNNSVVNVVPALRNANISTTTNLNLPANPSSVNYDEPAYFNVGPISAGGVSVGGVSYTVQFPLRLLKHSIFSIDKDLYFGQSTYLKIYFGPLDKICYTSDSNNNPSAGTKLSYAPLATNGLPAIGFPSLGTAGAGAYITPANGGCTPINITLQLAIETNQDIRTMLINKVATEGLTYIIPYLQAYKNPNQGTSQTITMQLDAGNGRTLERVYHSLYNATERLDTMYDHANTGDMGTGYDSSVNNKILQYYTQLNGQRIQQLTLDCTFTGAFTDYMYHRSRLRKSILSNINIYQYNWFHSDDWSGFGPEYDQDGRGDLISGIPMSVQPLTWAFVGTNMRALNNNFMHYTWFVFTKKLTATVGTVIVQ